MFVDIGHAATQVTVASFTEAGMKVGHHCDSTLCLIILWSTLHNESVDSCDTEVMFTETQAFNQTPVHACVAAVPAPSQCRAMSSHADCHCDLACLDVYANHLSCVFRCFLRAADPGQRLVRVVRCWGC